MEKEKVPLADARNTAAALLRHLRKFCVRCKVAGSVRRKKPEVSDIEIVYVPKEERKEISDQLFPHSQTVNLMDEEISKLVAAGLLRLRLNKHGRPIGAGRRNKFLVHVASGMPLDFFSCPLENWCNVLTCRTGSAESNERISNAALAGGYHWRTGGPGFEAMSDGGIIPVYSEEEVFAFVGLEYLRPELRV